MTDAFDRLASRRARPAPSAVLFDYALIAAQSAPSRGEADIAEAIVAYGDGRDKEAKTIARVKADRAEIDRLRAILLSHGIR